MEGIPMRSAGISTSDRERTGMAHGSLADALATLAVQRWLEQWLVAE